MSMLEKFGIDASAFAAITDTTLFEGTGTTTLRAGKRVPYTGSINGTTIPCYVTMHEAKLTRLSLLKQLQVSSNREYWLATGILKPVKMDIELMIDGEAINLIDFLHQITQQASNSTFSRDEFVMNSRRIGFNFDEGMPMFFQQFGASFDGFGHAINAFKAAGATDVIGKIQNAGRIQAAYAHETGVPVTLFEMGTVDRSKSPRNQGFLNIVDAQVDQFTRILGFRKQSRMLKAEIASADGWSQEKIKKVEEKSKSLEDMSKQWVSSWSGAQQRIVNSNGTYITENTFDPVNAPCGRFTMMVNGNETQIDLWSNSARANSSTPPPAVTAKEEPF